MRVLMQCQNVISTFQKMFSVFMLFLDYTSQIKADIPVIHFQLPMVIFWLQGYFRESWENRIFNEINLQ